MGTVGNAIVVGPAVNGALDVLPALGPGPRDKLMTGIAARGQSLCARCSSRRCWPSALPWGPVGIGTGAYAVCIGPLTHVLLPRLTATAPTRQEGSNRDD